MYKKYDQYCRLNIKIVRSPGSNAAFECVGQANPTIKWRELETGKIYAVTKVRHLKTRFGEAAIARVVLPSCAGAQGWKRNVWSPERLTK